MEYKSHSAFFFFFHYTWSVFIKESSGTIKNLKKKKKKPTTVQICRLENIEHESMKQLSYSGKYVFSLS